MLSNIRNSIGRSNRELFQEFKRFIKQTAVKSETQCRTEKADFIKLNNDKNKWMRLNLHKNHRALSTIQTKVNPAPIQMALVTKEESRDFMALFPDLVRDLTDAGRHTDIFEVNKRFAKILQYNVPTGKKLRGFATIGAYKLLEHPDRLTPENVKLANVLGWCVEMLQSTFLIWDDIMDASETRRGVPCWYKQPEVGLIAVNDGYLLECGIYNLLRKYLFDHPCYREIVEIFHDISLKTSMGQALDCKPYDENSLDSFTMNRYNAIVKYKTSYYSFCLPVALAMYLANIKDKEMHRQAETIMLEIGHFFQVQDDFIDVFGDVSLTGKVGTDIRDAKCSWLVVVALQRATPEQRQILKECYGKSDPAAVETVLRLYRDLGLPNTFSIYEEETYNLIKTHIQQMSQGLPHKLFFTVLDKCYKRET